MAQQVKVPHAKTGNLNSVLRLHMVEGQNWLPQISIWPPHVYHGTYTYTNKVNEWMNEYLLIQIGFFFILRVDMIILTWQKIYSKVLSLVNYQKCINKRELCTHMKDYLNTIEIAISEHPPHTETILHINVYPNISMQYTFILIYTAWWQQFCFA